MRRLIRRWLANRILPDHLRLEIEAQQYAEPWVRRWFRQEFWEPARRELLGLYPPGHPYHQKNPIVRFYPLAMVLFCLSPIAWAVVKAMVRWVTR